MCAQHEEGISTHLEHNLELLLEAKAIDRLNKNRVYGISLTIVQDMRLGCSVSTIYTLQSS
jgi:hypothetical protein